MKKNNDELKNNASLANENSVTEKEAKIEEKDIAKSSEEKEVKDSKEKTQKEKKAKRLKKEKEFNPEKNANAFKRGSFSIAFIAIFCAVLVLANILAALIANKYSTTIDVTADRSSKLSAENIDYLKKLNKQTDIKKIEVIVCATKASYTGSEMINYAYNNYQVQESNTPYSYFNQTVRLIEEYPKYANKISVSYRDSQDPSFSDIASTVSSDISYGDILVLCTKEDNSTKTDLLTFKDIYSMQSSSTSSSYTGYYTIAYSNLENALSGSLNKVAMSITKKAGIITQNCDSDSVAYLQDYLKNYDYDYSTVDGNFTLDAIKQYDVLIISKLKNDFSSNSLKILDNYLENGGNLGKSVVYFASQSSPETPNFNMFLEDWGIGTEHGVVYESSSYNTYGNAVTPMQTLSENDIVSSLSASTKFYLSTGNVPFKTLYTTSGDRSTNILLQSSSTCLVAPKGTTQKTTFPSSATQSSFPTIILTKDTRTTDDNKEISSSVLAFATSDFVSEDWGSYSSVGNMELAMLSINSASGRNTSLTFNPKITGITGITNPASDAVKVFVRVLFVVVVPILLIAGGVIVWTIRKRR